MPSCNFTSIFISQTQIYKFQIMKLKKMLIKKKKLPKYKIVALSEVCSTILQHKLSPKLKDSESFTLSYSIENSHNINAFMNSRTSINLMILSIYRKLGLGDSKKISITLQLGNRSIKHPYRMVEDCSSKLKISSFQMISS